MGENKFNPLTKIIYLFFKRSSTLREARDPPDVLQKCLFSFYKIFYFVQAAKCGDFDL